MLAISIGVLDVALVSLYVAAIVFLGWLGYRKTTSSADYLVAGRKAHPFVMAMSYGATFISTSAIIGFGGVAGLFGMSMLWLVSMNILIGIFVAFVFLGGRVRKLGSDLDAQTFPDLLGKRFDSKTIQVVAGLIVFLFMPLYAASVLMGGCSFVVGQFAGLNYYATLVIISVIVGVYVVMGGLKGVMYTDALHGTVMVAGMVFLVVFTYAMIGGVVGGHRQLTDLADLVPAKLQSGGHNGWTAMPTFGFGAAKYSIWWTVVTSISLGVSIGVLAQPQLITRFMTVKSRRELNRAVPIGGLFILLIPGSAYLVGSLTNAYYFQHGPLLTGRVVETIDAEKGHCLLQRVEQNEASEWVDAVGAPIPALLDAETPYLSTDAPFPVAQGRTCSVGYAGEANNIITRYIRDAMPTWFKTVFLLTLLAAAISTMSNQYHTLGAAFGRDIVSPIFGGAGGIAVTRVGILISIVATVVVAAYAEAYGGGVIIARTAAIFFGLCSAAFLPALVGGLYFKRMTKQAALASMVVGLLVTVFWLLLVKTSEAKALGLVQIVTGGKTSILADHPNWPDVDATVVALPLSVLTAVVVSLFTKPASPTPAVAMSLEE